MKTYDKSTFLILFGNRTKPSGQLMENLLKERSQACIKETMQQYTDAMIEAIRTAEYNRLAHALAIDPMEYGLLSTQEQYKALLKALKKLCNLDKAMETICNAGLGSIAKYLGVEYEIVLKLYQDCIN